MLASKYVCTYAPDRCKFVHPTGPMHNKAVSTRLLLKIAMLQDHKTGSECLYELSLCLQYATRELSGLMNWRAACMTPSQLKRQCLCQPRRALMDLGAAGAAAALRFKGGARVCRLSCTCKHAISATQQPNSHCVKGRLNTSKIQSREVPKKQYTKRGTQSCNVYSAVACTSAGPA